MGLSLKQKGQQRWVPDLCVSWSIAKVCRDKWLTGSRNVPEGRFWSCAASAAPPWCFGAVWGSERSLWVPGWWTWSTHPAPAEAPGTPPYWHTHLQRGNLVIVHIKVDKDHNPPILSVLLFPTAVNRTGCLCSTEGPLMFLFREFFLRRITKLCHTHFCSDCDHTHPTWMSTPSDLKTQHSHDSQLFL